MIRLAFISVVSLLFFSACDAPSVVNQDVQKELSNRKVRHIEKVDIELFGLVFCEGLLSDLSTQGINTSKIDSINNLEGFSLDFINQNQYDTSSLILQQQFEQFNYELERGQELSVNGYYNTEKNPPFFYSTKALIQNSTLKGFWLLKITEKTVIQNLPEE